MGEYRKMKHTEQVLVCVPCGVMVVNTEIHDQIHTDQERALVAKQVDEAYEKFLISENAARDLLSPRGGWFVYGLDAHAYPIGFYETELEARKGAAVYDHVVFWPFGKSWGDVKAF